MNDIERVNEMWAIENEKKALGYNLIAGVDEAGRGPLAGPVCVASVILPENAYLEKINDSKKLTEKKREVLFDIICEKAISYSIGIATEEEIDEINILNATFLAMRRAVEGLSVKPDYALIDGNQHPKLSIPDETVVKGDGKSMSIAAASILAKVSRDRFMLQIAEKYPEYCFEKHKGYGTKLHYEMIEKYGVAPVHRRSFLKKILGDKNG